MTYRQLTDIEKDAFDAIRGREDAMLMPGFFDGKDAAFIVFQEAQEDNSVLLFPVAMIMRPEDRDRMAGPQGEAPGTDLEGE